MHTPPEQPAHRDQQDVDFSELDLSHLDDLDWEVHTPPISWQRWTSLIGIVIVGGALLWLPHTEFYLAYQHSAGLFFGVCAAAATAGLVFGRTLYLWAEETAARYAERAALRPQKVKDDRPAPPWVRWVVLLVGLSLIGLVLFVLPRDVQTAGTGYSELWFLASGAAIVGGMVLGRWLMMQAEAQRKLDTTPRRPFVAPHWLKWVTLSLLVAGGVVVSFGTSLFATSDPEGLGFGLSGLGLLIGICGAIWLARRFDEIEIKVRNQAALNRIQTPEE